MHRLKKSELILQVPGYLYIYIFSTHKTYIFSSFITPIVFHQKHVLNRHRCTCIFVGHRWTWYQSGLFHKCLWSGRGFQWRRRLLHDCFTTKCHRHWSWGRPDQFQYLLKPQTIARDLVNALNHIPHFQNLTMQAMVFDINDHRHCTSRRRWRGSSPVVGSGRRWTRWTIAQRQP